jgi:predicted permease
MFYMFVARLATDSSFSQLEAELGTMTRRFAEAYPQENAKYKEVTARVFPRLGLQATVREGMRSMLNVLLAIGGVLLILGCANVANMLIARAIRREPEVAIRQALGASGQRLAQWQLTESCLLALGGATLGVLLAVLLTQIIRQLVFPMPPGFDIDMPVDVRVLGATLAAAIATGVVAGTAPAWLMTRMRRSLVGAVGRSGGGRTSSRAPRLRSALAVVQLALSLTLLVGALLLGTTLRHLRGLDLGFDPTNLMALQVSLGAEGYTAERALAFQDELQRTVASAPGIQSVAVGYRPPFGASTSVQLLAPGGDARDPALRAFSNGVSDTYFSTVATPIVRGRAFTADEAFTRAPRETMPVIVSESLARLLFGDADPLGRTVRLAATLSHPVRELPIVGVAKDAYRSRVTVAPEPFLYQPIGRYDLSPLSTSIMVRSAESLPAVTAAVRAAVARIDRAVPVLPARPLALDIDRSLRQQRLFATMLGWVSVLAFVLAGVGLHGLVSQAAIERTREFGIRLALGAQRGQIARLIARWVLGITGFGTIAGLGCAWLGTSLVKSMLFGVTALDPAIYVTAVLIMAGIVVVAAAWPAFRATRVEPVDVLRAE